MCGVLATREDEQAVNLNPQFVLAHDTLAGLFLKSGQINLAEPHAREALRLLPSDQAALYHLIQALRRSDDKKELPDLIKRLADSRREPGKRKRCKIATRYLKSSQVRNERVHFESLRTAHETRTEDIRCSPNC